METTVIDVIMWIAYLITLYFLIYWLTFFIDKKKIIWDEKKQIITLKKFPLVSIIVPAYNEEKTIVKTLKSIINLDYPKNKLEIIVINDGSKDRTKEVAERFIKNHKNYNIRLINQKNAGKAAALNKGLSILKGKYFACLDADSFVESQSLRYVIDLHEKDKDLAIITPILEVEAPKSLIQKFQRLEYMSAMLIIKMMSFMDCNYVAPGPFSVYKAQIIRKIGGFDINNLVEDQEIAYRVQLYHYKIRQCPYSIVRTVAPYDVKALQKQRNRWFKGTLLNLVKYKKLIMNKDYGDFGFFQMPLTFFAFFLSFAAIISFGYYLLQPIFKQFHDLALVNYDIMTHLQNLEFNFNILNIDLSSMFVLYVMLGIAIILLYFSSRMIDTRIRKYGKFYIIIYFIVYFIILSIFMVKVVIEVLLGKKQQKW